MKQPEYSPLEALERIKLMMKYDLSKTSVENKMSEKVSKVYDKLKPNVNEVGGLFT